MKATAIVLCIVAAAGCAMLFGDRAAGASSYPMWEVKAVLSTPNLASWELKTLAPRETEPGRFVQVSEADLQRLAGDGWQLVGVTPHVIVNEERGPVGRKVAVTQTYPAYYFQRPRPTPTR
ncbi:MAG: hypothetical protein KIT09_17645 [Bryobacteraceae bacterium]|nr:hypothetical protein [Bryobacteraceae bacterium]